VSSYRRATVTGTGWRGPDVLEAQLSFEDGSKGNGLALVELVGEVAGGDEVIANTTAVEIGLGSGGFHFILWNLSRSALDTQSGGHIMKLRYTPLQFNVEAVEEKMGCWEGPVELSDALGGMPVVAGSLHSQLLAVALAYKDARPEGRLVYIMTDGGSLPLKFSDTVRFMVREGYLESTLTYGNAFGGEFEAVNVYGALTAAREICAADAAVVLMGPGIVGTGSAVGFTGMEQATVINAAGSLGGFPIAIARITFGDARERHAGLSHHTVSALKYGACMPATVPVPRMSGEKKERVWSQLRGSGIEEAHRVREVACEGVLELIERSGYSPTVMGRTAEEEPEFFMAAGAAGYVAANQS
jgi:hypothetical protein